MKRETQNFVTICTKIEDNNTPEGHAKIDAAIRRGMGNYPDPEYDPTGEETHTELTKRIDKLKLIHFVSLNVIPGGNEKEPGYLVLEMTVDGEAEDAIEAFAAELQSELIPIYGLVDGSITSCKALTRKLLHDYYKIVRSPWPEFFNPKSINGLPFSGTVGLDLNDMRGDELIATFANETMEDLRETKLFLESADNVPGSPNTPNSIFEFVKKRIVSQSDDYELGEAWSRANQLKQSPGFAEQMDSSWKETWDQVKLVTAVIPGWLWGIIGLLYLTVAAFIGSKLFGREISEVRPVQNWDHFRFSGSPFSGPADAGRTIVSLDPIFLVQGLLWAFLLYFVFRLAPRVTKRPSGSMTLLTGMALYLFFPNFFDFNHIQLQTIKEFLDVPDALNPVKPILPLLGLALFLFTLRYVIKGLYHVSKIPSFQPVKFSTARLFNRVHEWVFFGMSLLLFGSFFYLGFSFFAGDKIGGIFKPRLSYDFAYQFGGEISPEVAQYVWVPVIVGSIMALSINSVIAHLPTLLRRKLTGLKPFRQRPKFFTLFIAFLFAGAVFWAGFVDQEHEAFELFMKTLFGLTAALILGCLSAMVVSLFWSTRNNIKGPALLFTGVWAVILYSDFLLSSRMISGYFSALIAVPITTVILLILSLIGAAAFSRSQAANKQRYDNPYTDVTERIFDTENRVVQNHMLSVQRLVPENFRRNITLPLMLQAIYGVLIRQRFRPGFLSSVGTVHSARWIHLPETDNYVFFSNYDGSFESYLEDFSKLATEGTNLAWANCEGFPKIHGMFKGGVEDSDRFKRYARRSMKPAAFWYTAFKDKSAEEIRRNALIRDGLTQDSLSASQAQAWLDLFTSIPRPEWVIEKHKIQNLMFGGNGKLKYGACFTLEAEDGKPVNPEALSKWVAKILPSITFKDNPESDCAYVAFSSAGIRALGLGDTLDDEISDPNNTLDAEYGRTFSQPFVSGMYHRSRRNILGDTGTSASNHWTWSDRSVLAVLLLYSDNKDFMSAFNPSYASGLKLKRVRDFDPKNTDGLNFEPFGFADGISQPIIKGTKQAAAFPQSIHLVEPGEFILGYRDNRGHFPPSPVIESERDVSNVLPNSTEEIVQRYPSFSESKYSKLRDLGRNGSYLVIRELEQDVDAFNLTAKKAALQLRTQTVRPAMQEMAELEPKFTRSLPKLIEKLKENDDELDDETFRENLTEKLNEKDSNFEHYEEMLKYLMVGRRKDGSSLADRPILITQNRGQNITLHDPHKNDAPPSLHELKAGNEFLFKDSDPQGFKCPFGSHVRRSNPRDGLIAESDEGLSITQRHRILRRGRSYTDTTGDKTTRGTFFMCLNADIDRQFEFLQQTWLMSPKFHGLRSEVDPIAGQGLRSELTKGESIFSIQHADGDINLKCMSDFVTMKAGGYFFLPGKDCLTFFANIGR